MLITVIYRLVMKKLKKRLSEFCNHKPIYIEENNTSELLELT